MYLWSLLGLIVVGGAPVPTRLVSLLLSLLPCGKVSAVGLKPFTLLVGFYKGTNMSVPLTGRAFTAGLSELCVAITGRLMTEG